MIYQAETNIGLCVTNDYKVGLDIGGTRIGLSIPGALDLSDRLRHMASAAEHGWVDKAFIESSKAEDLPHAKEYSLQEIEALLESAGVRDVHISIKPFDASDGESDVRK